MSLTPERNKRKTVNEIIRVKSDDPMLEDESGFEFEPISLEEVDEFFRICNPQTKKYGLDDLHLILNEIANTGAIVKSLSLVKMTLGNYHYLRKKYPEFKALHEKAMDAYRERLQRAVHNRAVEGWLEPVYYKGELSGYTRRYSDRLLELQAKRHVEGYKDHKQVDLNVTNSVMVIPVSTNNESDEEWADRVNKKPEIVSDSPAVEIETNKDKE